MVRNKSLTPALRNLWTSPNGLKASPLTNSRKKHGLAQKQAKDFLFKILMKSSLKFHD
jgi:hypothetical protein